MFKSSSRTCSVSSMEKNIVDLKINIKQLQIQAKKAIKMVKTDESMVKKALAMSSSSTAILLHAESAVRRQEEYKNCLSQIAHLEGLLSEIQANLLLYKTKKITKKIERQTSSKKEETDQSVDSMMFNITYEAKLLIEKLALENPCTSQESNINHIGGFTDRFSRLSS